MKTKLNRILWISILFLSITIVLFSNVNTIKPPEPQNLLELSGDLKEGNPKMEYVLYKLMSTYFKQGMEEAKKFAKQRKIDMQDGFVRVVAESNEIRYSSNVRDSMSVKRSNYLIIDQSLLSKIIVCHSLRNLHEKLLKMDMQFFLKKHPAGWRDMLIKRPKNNILFPTSFEELKQNLLKNKGGKK